MKKINKNPIKSASQIILRKCKNPQKYFDYEILFIKRAAKMAFQKVYAFPGGKLDQSDIDLGNKLDINPYRICSQRETFEETGLYILNQSMNNDILNDFSQLQKTKEQFQNNNWDSSDFNIFSQEYQCEYGNDKVQEFIRLITAPFLPARFDTQFFITCLKNEQKSVINWQQYLKENKSDLDNIYYNKSEVTDYKWLNPMECLELNKTGVIQLAPPQIMILNILSSFQNMQQIQDYLKTKITNPQDKLQENPFNFPYIFAGIKTSSYDNQTYKQYPYTLVMPGDLLYPLEMVLQQEKDPVLKKEIINKFSTLQLNQNNKSRILAPEFKNFFSFNKNFETQINQISNTPFNYFKSTIDLNRLMKRHAQQFEQN